MYMARCPIMGVVPIALFLTASFFVLFTLRKVTDKWLKVLGYSALVLLLFSALVIFSSMLLDSARGLKMCPMSGKMKSRAMMRMMDKNNMPEMAMPEKGLPPKE